MSISRSQTVARFLCNGRLFRATAQKLRDLVFFSFKVFRTVVVKRAMRCHLFKVLIAFISAWLAVRIPRPSSLGTFSWNLSLLCIASRPQSVALSLNFSPRASQRHFSRFSLPARGYFIPNQYYRSRNGLFCGLGKSQVAWQIGSPRVPESSSDLVASLDMTRKDR